MARWTKKVCSGCSSESSTNAAASSGTNRRSRNMVVVMQEGAQEEQIQKVIDRLVQIGFDVHRSTGTTCTVLGVVGAKPVDPAEAEVLDGGRACVKIST